MVNAEATGFDGQDATIYNSIEKLFLFPLRMTVFFLNGLISVRGVGSGVFRNNQYAIFPPSLQRVRT